MYCLVFLMKNFQPQQTDQWQSNESSETAFPQQDLNNDNINRNSTKQGGGGISHPSSLDNELQATNDC